MNLTVGDSFDITFVRSDYPVSESWAVKMAFVKLGSKVAEFDGTPQGADEYNFVATSDQTKTLPTGGVDVSLVFSKAGERQTKFIGSWTILPNPLGVMVSSSNQEQLDAVNETITTILSEPAASASFNGQSYSTHNINDLFTIRDRLQALVNSELRAIGATTKGSGRLILTRFR